MDFIHEVDLSIVLSELILCIYENQATFSSNLSSALKKCQSVLLKNFIFFRCCKTLGKNFFFRDVCIMLTNFCFSGGSNDGSREFFVLAHTFRKTNATNLTNTTLIGAPSTATEITAHNHFNWKTFAEQAYSDHRVWSREFPVWADVCSGI